MVRKRNKNNVGKMHLCFYIIYKFDLSPQVQVTELTNILHQPEIEFYKTFYYKLVLEKS